MGTIDIKSLSRKELESVLAALNAPPYRATQIFRWLYREGVRSFDEMADLPESLRGALKARCHIAHVVLLDSKRSELDGTTKYLFKLEDAQTIETVFLPEGERTTLCLSSQVGCKHACAFCASAPFGFVRNLSSAEIVDEVIAVRRMHPSSIVTNIVFMGIGEPLDNYNHVMAAIRTFNDRSAFNIGARRITISTCGIIPAIRRLAGEGLQVELSISLHAPDDETRSRLVPINKRYPVKDLLQECRDYTRVTGRIVTFEYVLMKGVNSSQGDAARLASIVQGMKCKVNTISYNQVRAKGYLKPSAGEIERFVRTLKELGVNAMHRKSKGEDIDAGCGQLRIARM